MPEEFITPGKKHRRDPGSGGLFRRSNGLWVGTVELPAGPDGKRRQKTVSSKSKAEAIRKLNDIKAQLSQGITPTSGRDTVQSWVDYWLDHIAKGQVRPNTLRQYRYAAKNNIHPHIGSRRLTALTSGDVRHLIDTMLAEGKSTSTVANTYNVLSQALDAAKREHPPRIQYNPCDNVRRPKVTYQSRRALSWKEAQALLLTSAQANDAATARWAVYLMCGLRQGECLGLTWDRVDLVNNVLDVSWQLQRVPPSEPEGPELVRLTGQWAFTPPKSRRSRRLVPIIPQLAEILRRYRSIAPPNRWGLLWLAESGLPLDGNGDREQWYAALDRAEIPRVVIHAARHSAITLMQQMGVPEDVRLRIAGQSTVAIHRSYAHTSLDTLREQMQKMSELLPPSELD